MVTFNESDPKCPKCNNPCGSDYRCKYCNCNMHWFCTVDQSDGSELGHGAHYVCSNCGPKKMTSGPSNASSAGSNSISRHPNNKRRAAASTKKSKKSSNVHHQARVAHPATPSTKSPKNLGAGHKDAMDSRAAVPASKTSRTSGTRHRKASSGSKSLRKSGKEVTNGPVEVALTRAITLPNDDVSPMAKHVFEQSLLRFPSQKSVDFDDSFDEAVDEEISNSSEEHIEEMDAFSMLLK